MSTTKQAIVSRGWILFDRSGHITILDVDKYAIMRRTHITPRDLRLLDPSLSYPSMISIRKNIIIFNFEHIKAIISREEILLEDSKNEKVVDIVRELESRLPHVNAIGCNEDHVEKYEINDFSFGLCALKIILDQICKYLDVEAMELEIEIISAVDEFTSKINGRNVNYARMLKRKMREFTRKVEKVKNELAKLLGDEDNAESISSSNKLKRHSSSLTQFEDYSSIAAIQRHNDVDAIVSLIEVYLSQVNGILSKLIMLREYTDEKGDYINFQLQNIRNQLIQLKFVFTASSVSEMIIGLAVGIFGMSIPYSWNEGHGHLFKWVIVVTALVAFSVFLWVMAYARRKGHICF